MKKLGLFTVALALVAFSAFAGGKKDESSAQNAETLQSQTESSANTELNVIASTSWTAAFADLAGVDVVSAVAPASLRHPPEYEVTISDIEKINKADVFVYAGFERMMKTLGDSVGNATMVKIVCDNSIATVLQSSSAIATVCGTQSENQIRVAKYVSAIDEAAKKIEAAGLKGAKVLCNRNQIYLAKDLGFDVSATFGPGPVTAEQIADAKSGNYAFIIDNVHNPVAQPLVEVAPNSKHLVWRNFPERIEQDALLNVVLENINMIF